MIGEFQLLALSVAQDAHVNNFPSRRGSYPINDVSTGEVLAIYNNNPYGDRPMLRDLETQRFRVKLAEHGLTVLAEASYPVGGEDNGYTIALIIDAASKERQLLANQLYQACVDQSIDEMVAEMRG